MPRRALMAGDIVAAAPHRRGRQTHLADRLDPGQALHDGVLIPHCRYVVVKTSRDSVAKTARRSLWVTIEGAVAAEVKVRPSAVRLWTNPEERRRRYLTEAAAKIQRRKAC